MFFFFEKWKNNKEGAAFEEKMRQYLHKNYPLKLNPDFP